MRLFRQLHLAQECLPARVAVQTLPKRVEFYLFEADVALLLRAIEPGKDLIGLSTIGENFSDAFCIDRCIKAFLFRQCRVGLGSAPDQYISSGSSIDSVCHVGFFFGLSEYRVRLADGE